MKQEERPCRTSLAKSLQSRSRIVSQNSARQQIGHHTAFSGKRIQLETVLAVDASERNASIRQTVVFQGDELKTLRESKRNIGGAFFQQQRKPAPAFQKIPARIGKFHFGTPLIRKLNQKHSAAFRKSFPVKRKQRDGLIATAVGNAHDAAGGSAGEGEHFAFRREDFQGSFSGIQRKFSAGTGYCSRFFRAFQNGLHFPGQLILPSVRERGESENARPARISIEGADSSIKTEKSKVFRKVSVAFRRACQGTELCRGAGERKAGFRRTDVLLQKKQMNDPFRQLGLRVVDNVKSHRDIDFFPQS